MGDGMEKIEFPKVGDVLYASWGYDQTNIDFYQVVRISNASVWLRPMNQKVKQVGFMSEEVVPNEVINGKPFVARWNAHGYAKVGYAQFAQAYDGRPKYQSHYA
jgi:hypothetical protein